MFMKIPYLRKHGTLAARVPKARQKQELAYRLSSLRIFAAILALLSAFILQPSALPQESVCAQVRIEILQELTLEREAFEARMTINNGLAVPLENIAVEVSFADRTNGVVRASWNPNDLTAKFFIRYQTGSGLPGSIAAGTSAKILWLIIPAPGAAGQDHMTMGLGWSAMMILKTKPGVPAFPVGSFAAHFPRRCMLLATAQN